MPRTIQLSLWLYAEIRNAALSLPAIHFGATPRPVYVLPVSGSWYLGATFLPVVLPFVLLPVPGSDRSATVSPCSVINVRTLAMPSALA